MSSDSISLHHPHIADGGVIHSLAADSGELDLNSSYSYLLWCRDFSTTSVVAFNGDEPAGFVTGYFRPESPNTLFVWQVAVAKNARGKGLALSMLNWLTERTSADHMETTITADNAASIALFTRFALDNGAEMEKSPLFTKSDFPDGHDTEYLHQISPLNT